MKIGGAAMDRAIEKRIGANIGSLREKKNLTQDDLAVKHQLAGWDVSRSSVAKIEVGQRHIYSDEILLIKNALKVSFEDIFNMD